MAPARQEALHAPPAMPDGTGSAVLPRQYLPAPLYKHSSPQTPLGPDYQSIAARGSLKPSIVLEHIMHVDSTSHSSSITERRLSPPFSASTACDQPGCDRSLVVAVVYLAPATITDQIQLHGHLLQVKVRPTPSPTKKRNSGTRSMGGQSYSSTSSLESGDSSMGSQRELINISGAHLCLIDGEESVRMTSGDFSLKLLKQTYSPLAALVASVGEVQWPVGKDAPVLKVWNRRYTFALPGLVYGMVLPDTTPTAVLHHFEAILAEYSAYETHYEIANAVQCGTSGRRDDPGFWTAVAPEVESLSSTVARNIDSTSTIVASSIVVGGDWAASGIRQGAALMRREAGRSESEPQESGDGGVSPRMMRRMQQARRMSAVVKLMSRTLLKGAISATGHVSKGLGLDANAGSATSYGSPNDTARNVAVASVDAFGKVVEAVETAGKSLYDATQKAGTDFVQERFGHEAGQVVQDGFGAVGNVINTAWTLNKMGVKMLLRMTAASTALSTRSGNSKSTTSTVTDDAQSGSSSTYSTGSMPMKQAYHSPTQTLHREILPPPQQQHQQVVAWSDPPLHLSSPANARSGQELHTSQLFPTSAEQMRNYPSSVNTPPGNYTGILPPAPRSNSPSQQYHNHWNVPQVQAPFSFQRAPANLQQD